jgi:hypothetical protein
MRRQPDFGHAAAAGVERDDPVALRAGDEGVAGVGAERDELERARLVDRARGIVLPAAELGDQVVEIQARMRVEQRARRVHAGNAYELVGDELSAQLRFRIAQRILVVAVGREDPELAGVRVALDVEDQAAEASHDRRDRSALRIDAEEVVVGQLVLNRVVVEIADFARGFERNRRIEGIGIRIGRDRHRVVAGDRGRDVDAVVGRVFEHAAVEVQRPRTRAAVDRVATRDLEARQIHLDHGVVTLARDERARVVRVDDHVGGLRIEAQDTRDATVARIVREERVRTRAGDEDLELGLGPGAGPRRDRNRSDAGREERPRVRRHELVIAHDRVRVRADGPQAPLRIES